MELCYHCWTKNLLLPLGGCTCDGHEKNAHSLHPCCPQVGWANIHANFMQLYANSFVLLNPYASLACLSCHFTFFWDSLNFLTVLLVTKECANPFMQLHYLIKDRFIYIVIIKHKSHIPLPNPCIIVPQTIQYSEKHHNYLRAIAYN